MWVCIGIALGLGLWNLILITGILFRVRDQEAMLNVVSDIVLKSFAPDALLLELKSRKDHPAGKKLTEEDGDAS